MNPRDAKTLSAAGKKLARRVAGTRRRHQGKLAKPGPFGVWGEDELTISKRLTITPGFRWDYMNATSPEAPVIDPTVSIGTTFAATSESPGTSALTKSQQRLPRTKIQDCTKARSQNIRFVFWIFPKTQTCPHRAAVLEARTRRLTPT